MASWMIHFRVADAILQADVFQDVPHAVRAAFVLGNIAPDSGVPHPSGVGYIPNKDTSHFMRVFDSPMDGLRDRCDPHRYAEEWLLPALRRHDPITAAFHLGYISHLITDNAWLSSIVLPAKERFAHLRLENGVETPEAVARFYAFLKKDWYDMDFLYLKQNPGLSAYRLFLEAEDVENRYLPHFPANAFILKQQEIRAFYRHGVAEVTERKTYLEGEELEAFILNAKKEIFKEFSDRFTAALAVVPLPVE